MKLKKFHAGKYLFSVHGVMCRERKKFSVSDEMIVNRTVFKRMDQRSERRREMEKNTNGATNVSFELVQDFIAHHGSIVLVARVVRKSQPRVRLVISRYLRNELTIPRTRETTREFNLPFEILNKIPSMGIHIYIFSRMHTLPPVVSLKI